MADAFPELAAALARLPDAVLDAELVVPTNCSAAVGRRNQALLDVPRDAPKTKSGTASRDNAGGLSQINTF